jgi:hypothetical protein
VKHPEGASFASVDSTLPTKVDGTHNFRFSKTAVPIGTYIPDSGSSITQSQCILRLVSPRLQPSRPYRLGHCHFPSHFFSPIPDTFLATATEASTLSEQLD